MAFYYVKSGGTATGDAGRSLTERTGSFASMGASNYYNSVYDVFAGGIPTTAPDGDTVIVSSSHSETSSSTYRLGIASITNGLINKLVSKDDTDVNTQKKGASISVTSGNLELGNRSSNKNNFFICGFDFLVDDTFDVYARYSSITLYLCDITNLNGNAYLQSLYQNNLVYHKCTFDIASYFRYSYDITLLECDGAIKKGDRSFTDGSGTLRAYSCDFSSSTVPSMTSQNGKAEFYNCKLTDAMLDLSVSSEKRNGYAKAVSCSSPSYGGYFYDALATSVFNQYTDTQVYLNYKYDGVNSASSRMETKGENGLASPARFKVCEIPAQDLASTDKTFRVNLLLDADTKATLTDSEFWIDLTHNNNTDLSFADVVTSRNSDILSVGTELTASTGIWQGTLPTNKKAYQVDIALSAASLSNVTNGNIVVYANLATANTDVYIDPAIQIGV